MRFFNILALLLFSFSFHLVSAQSTDALNTELDSIYKTDQKIRFQLIDLQKKGGMNSEEFKNLVLKMRRTDSINLSKVKKILDRCGWPENLTQQGNQTLFLVIQHADLQTQNQYLPLVRHAVKEGKTSPANLALLEDRIALRKGEEQSYGSQVFIDSKTGQKYVQPLQNPETVDERRAEVGLPPMKDYLKQAFQMDWSVEQYYKDLPEIRKLIKERLNQNIEGSN